MIPWGLRLQTGGQTFGPNPKCNCAKVTLTWSACFSIKSISHQFALLIDFWYLFSSSKTKLEREHQKINSLYHRALGDSGEEENHFKQEENSRRTRIREGQPSSKNSWTGLEQRDTTNNNRTKHTLWGPILDPNTEEEQIQEMSVGVTSFTLNCVGSSGTRDNSSFKIWHIGLKALLRTDTSLY